MKRLLKNPLAQVTRKIEAIRRPGPKGSEEPQLGDADVL